MKITEVRIKQSEDFEEKNLKAVAAITFENIFVIHGIKIIESNGKTFISMPSKLDSNGKKQDIVHPIVTEYRNYISDSILKEYDKKVTGK